MTVERRGKSTALLVLAFVMAAFLTNPLLRAGEDDLRVSNFTRQVDPKLADFEQEANRRYANGDLRGAVESIEAGVAAAEKVGDPAIIAFFLSKAGINNREFGRSAVALKDFERAREINRRLIINTWVLGGDNVAAAYFNLETLYRKLGRKKDADKCLAEKRTVLAERKRLLAGEIEADPKNMATASPLPDPAGASSQAGELAESAGDYDKAVALYDEALRKTPIGGRRARGRILKLRGLALGRAGRAQEAGRALSEAAETYASIPDLADAADCWERASIQERRAGARVSALTHKARALSLAPRMALARRQAVTAQSEGIKARREKRDAEALMHFQRALDSYRILGEQSAIADSLINLSALKALQGDNQGALEYAQEAAKAYADAGAGGGMALSAVGAALTGLGRYTEAIRTYEQAWQVFLREGNEESEASVLWNLGGVWAILNDGRQAILCYNRAIRISEKFKNFKTIDTLRLHIAMMVERMDDPDATEQAWRARLDADRRFDYLPGAADSLRRLGDVSAFRGKSKLALGYYQESLDLQRKVGNKRNEFVVLLALAEVQRRVGDPSAATKTLDDALRSALSMKDHEAEFGALTMIAATRGFMGDYPGALLYANRALALARRLGHDGLLANAENSLGMLYNDIGDFEAGLNHYQLALSLAVKAKDGQQEIMILGNIAGQYLDMEDWENAISYCRRITHIDSWGGRVINLGYSYLGARDYDKAEKTFKQVGSKIGLAHIDLIHRRYPRALKAYSEMIKENEKDREYSPLLAQYAGSGSAHEGLGHYAQAADSYRKGQQLLERVRDGLGEMQKMHFLATNDWLFPRIGLHEGMVRVLPFLEEGLRGALYAAEFTRARVFAEAAARLYDAPQAPLPPALAERERGINARIAAAVHRADAAFKRDDKPDFESAEIDLAGFKKDQSVLVAELRRDFPAYASALYPRPVHVEEIRLAPGEILLEFEVTEPYTKVFVVRDKKIVSSYDVRLTREELDKMVRKYRGYFEGVKDHASLSAYDPGLGHELYRLLLKPARKMVPAGARLIIVPDEILGILPFESLVVSLPERLQSPSGKHGPAPAGVRYAGDEFDIAYAQSATVLTEMRTLTRTHSASREALIVADPVFNPADSRLRGTTLANAVLGADAIRTMGAVGRTMGLGGGRPGVSAVKTKAEEDFLFPRLDQTSILAERLGKVFGTGKMDSLIGLQASEKDLAQHDLASYRNLIFATHGILDGAVSGIREPALVLSQIGNESPRNGFLTMSKIMGLRLDADIVALTACETGLGRRLTGEGVMGLGRAFQFAGARNVLVSLWSVSEDSTTLFAERFFKYLREGKTKRTALRLARADVRREGYEHPFYWAPFILIGD